MSTYYTIACHTCKKKIDCAGYTREAVAKRAGEWAMWGHIAHDISIMIPLDGMKSMMKSGSKWINMTRWNLMPHMILNT
ncbi:hypothetical protein [Bacillus phage SPO1L4]|nr:hypothetical protein [Bacillus phage SPO1L4]